MRRILMIFSMLLLILTGCSSSANYKDYTLDNIKYNVPAGWNKEDNGDIVYYYPETGLLMVQKTNVKDSSNLTDKEKDSLYDTFEDGVSRSMSGYEKIESSKAYVDNDILARNFSFYADFDGNPYECKAVVFAYKDELYSFCLGKPEQIKKYDLDTFTDIIKSIEVLSLTE